jgi:GH15 family glucan-1,4-alpha-glucosidase
VLLALIFGYGADADRVATTVEAIRRELASGPYVRRYSGDDGLNGSEGAFLACSFWLVEALAKSAAARKQRSYSTSWSRSQTTSAYLPRRSTLTAASSSATSRRA